MPDHELLRLCGLLGFAGATPGPGLCTRVPSPPGVRGDGALFRIDGRSYSGEDFGGGADAKLARAAALLKAAYNAQAPEALFGLFTPFLKEEISLRELRGAFVVMRNELGRMTMIAVPQPAHSTTAEMPARFDYGTMTVFLTVDSQGLIDGLLMEQV